MLSNECPGLHEFLQAQAMIFSRVLQFFFSLSPLSVKSLPPNLLYSPQMEHLLSHLPEFLQLPTVSLVTIHFLMFLDQIEQEFL